MAGNVIRKVWILAAPLLFGPLLFLGIEMRCLFVICVISTYWIFDVAPMGIVSLFTLFLFPFLHIVPAKTISENFFKDSVVLFIVSLIMALSVQETQLHKRVALKILSIFGKSEQLLLYGFLWTTGFISFFVSDTACTAIMLPIALAIIIAKHDIHEEQSVTKTMSEPILLPTINISNSAQPMQESSSKNTKQEQTSAEAPKNATESESATQANNKQVDKQQQKAGESKKKSNRKGGSADNNKSEKTQDINSLGADSPQDTQDYTYRSIIDKTNDQVLKEIEEARKRDLARKTGGGEHEKEHDKTEKNVKTERKLKNLWKTMEKRDLRFAKAMVLGSAHASLIGGTAIITSTGPNLQYREVITNHYPDGHLTVTYLQWFLMAFPPMILLITASYICLVSLLMGPKHLFPCCLRKTDEKLRLEEAVQVTIVDSYKALGPLSFGEKSVMGFFSILILLWIFRKPGFMKGYGDVMHNDVYITDATVGLFICFIQFIWPKDPWKDGFFHAKPILDWNSMKHKFGWSAMLLIGAGYAVSAAVQKSGLSNMAACMLNKYFNSLPPLWLFVAICCTVVLFTEFSSNVSTASIFLPINIAIAEANQMNPLGVALSTAISSSYAFMLPMATPANAIVFDSKLISIFEMMYVGLFLNVFCIGITVLNMNTWAYWYLDLGKIPHIPHHRSIKAFNCSL